MTMTYTISPPFAGELAALAQCNIPATRLKPANGNFHGQRGALRCVGSSEAEASKGDHHVASE
ncbi:hypothetical protein [Burkholderia sp. Bp8963]|uniref:hypothetical protein n=1 Tax=Burkholderia sp. Bp8963 TaxID=2184547 RepID=UPI001639EE00|nr:hypothetical protein [Burkholderia sp. Bp8963]